LINRLPFELPFPLHASGAAPPTAAAKTLRPARLAYAEFRVIAFGSMHAPAG